jgi:hypothetical protein
MHACMHTKGGRKRKRGWGLFFLGASNGIDARINPGGEDLVLGALRILFHKNGKMYACMYLCIIYPSITFQTKSSSEADETRVCCSRSHTVLRFPVPSLEYSIGPDDYYLIPRIPYYYLCDARRDWWIQRWIRFHNVPIQTFQIPPKHRCGATIAGRPRERFRDDPQK